MKTNNDGSVKYWFRPKSYGYGLVPISWEGWLATLIFILILLVSVYINDIYSETFSLNQILRFILDLIIISTLFMVVFKDKIEGELKWNWGRK